MLRALVSLLALSLVACGAEDDPAPEPKSPGFSAVWAEFATPAELTATLPLLASRGLALNAAWLSASVADPELLELAATAARAGVEIRPWLLLSEADGYWPGSTNAPTFSANARALMDAWEGHGLAPTALIVDMELRYDRAVLVSEAMAKDPPEVTPVITLLQSSIDRAEFSAATLEYAGLVDEAHARGWQVHLTTLPLVLDDYADDDDHLRQALGIPIEGIAWDVLTFQAYRTLIGGLAGSKEPLTAFIVYDYGIDARERFGERAGLDLGLVGAGVTASPVYGSPAELRQDVEAAHAAGIPASQINVYNLDGMLERGPAEDWLEPPSPDPVPPPEDPASVDVRDTSELLDSVLTD